MIPAIRLQAKVMLDSFRFNEREFRLLVSKPVMADLTRRAIRVQNAARQFARGEGGGPHVRTGLLWNSIGYRLGLDSVSPYVDVGTAVYYAPYVEFGHKNRAHAYPIVTPGGKFTGRFGYVTNKPTRPYPFLRPAAQFARTI